MTVALIADIVGSRQLSDRAAAQRDLERAIADVSALLPVAVDPLRPIVGDELQGVYRGLRHAIATTLLLRLALPEGIECRYGIGIGEIHAIPSSVGDLSEGSAWWAARAAIETVEQRARQEVPQARTWVAAAEGAGDHAFELARVANAGLLARDRVIGKWSDRVRRLAYGRIAGVTQDELAEREGITQSAVSQALSTSGAGAIIAGFGELIGEFAGEINGDEAGSSAGA